MPHTEIGTISSTQAQHHHNNSSSSVYLKELPSKLRYEHIPTVTVSNLPSRSRSTSTVSSPIPTSPAASRSRFLSPMASPVSSRHPTRPSSPTGSMRSIRSTASSRRNSKYSHRENSNEKKSSSSTHNGNSKNKKKKDRAKKSSISSTVSTRSVSTVRNGKQDKKDSKPAARHSVNISRTSSLCPSSVPFYLSEKSLQATLYVSKHNVLGYLSPCHELYTTTPADSPVSESGNRTSFF